MLKAFKVICMKLCIQHSLTRNVSEVLSGSEYRQGAIHKVRHAIFHMSDKTIIGVTSQALDPSPSLKLSHLLEPFPPSSVTCFMDGPQSVLEPLSVN